MLSCLVRARALDPDYLDDLQGSGNAPATFRSLSALGTVGPVDKMS